MVYAFRVQGVGKHAAFLGGVLHGSAAAVARMHEELH